MNIIKDILKCAFIACLISIVSIFLIGMFYIIFITTNKLIILNSIKTFLYYIGCFGLFVSAGFFIQKNATRPLNYEDKWKQKFYKLNLGLVIMFISLFICIYGMLIQSILEKSY